MTNVDPLNSLVSVVVPVYNEEVNLTPFLKRLNAVLDTLSVPSEIILIDDGSRDSSPKMIAEAAERDGSRVRGVILNRNYGQHAAILAGFSVVRGGVVVTIDADLQNPPEEIPRLLEEVNKGFEVVGSVRRNRQDPLSRKVASALVNWVARASTGVTMRDYGCMLRAYTRNVVDAMVNCPEHSTFIPLLANTLSSRVSEIEVAHDGRAGGESKYNLWKLINLQFDLLTSITTLPLRLLSVFGFLLSGAGFFFGCTLLVLRIAFGSEWAAHGVFTLFAGLFFLVGAQFVGMGLLGEYIGRIYHDVRDRPRFVIRELLERKRGVSVSGENGLRLLGRVENDRITD